MKQKQRVNFRVFQMPCCGQLLCWVNPRLPSFCPECGKFIYTQLKQDGDKHTILNDENAWLSHNT